MPCRRTDTRTPPAGSLPKYPNSRRLTHPTGTTPEPLAAEQAEPLPSGLLSKLARRRAGSLRGSGPVPAHLGGARPLGMPPHARVSELPGKPPLFRRTCACWLRRTGHVCSLCCKPRSARLADGARCTFVGWLRGWGDGQGGWRVPPRPEATVAPHPRSQLGRRGCGLRFCPGNRGVSRGSHAEKVSTLLHARACACASLPPRVCLIGPVVGAAAGTRKNRAG